MTGNLYIMFGTLLIGFGGILATYGWNLKTTYSQKAGIIRTLVAEMSLNADIYAHPYFNEPNEQKLTQFRVFPRFQTSAIQAVIASGLFCDDLDRRFLDNALALNQALIDFNQRLTLSEEQMSPSKDRIKVFRKNIRDGVVRKNLGNMLNGFSDLLISQYGVTRSDRMFVSVND